ncbi:uncharacterized protein LOC103317083 [Nasonia vitripennis]|uniref:Reverse transcriptase domain-containing protein n=1 Tax=Nasonia vitripennis TaxID=7425 RepID=A0A7M7H8V3_NASVI|nr:uncharacterized protein LOC103317083 [Nasonia vitripennis]
MVGAFLDIQGTFNRTSTETVTEEAIKQNVPRPLIQWLEGMLNCRTMVSKLGTTMVTGVVSKGCAQRGVVFPTIWSAVANGLLEALNVGGAMPMPMLMLSVNPDKIELVIFTCKYTIETYRVSRLSDTTLEVKDSVKYLCVVLDMKLTALLLRLAYAALVRWPKVEQAGAKKALERIWGLITKLTTGALRTTTTKALGILVEVEPFHLTIICEAIKAAHRLNDYGQWKQETRHS